MQSNIEQSVAFCFKQSDSIHTKKLLLFYFNATNSDQVKASLESKLGKAPQSTKGSILFYILFPLGILFNIIVIRRLVHKNNIFTPILPLFYLSIASYTWLGVFVFDYATETPFRFFDVVRKEHVQEALLVFILSAGMFSIGAAIPTYFIKSKAATFADILKPISNRLKRVNPRNTVILSLSVSALYSFSFGLSNLIFRDVYIPELFSRTGVIVAVLLSPISMIAIGLLNSKKTRYTLLIISIFPFFAASSRAMLLIVFFYGVGSAIRNQRLSKVKSFLLITIAILLSAIAIEYRSAAQHGLIPYITILLTEGIPFDNVFYGLNYLLSFSVSVLSYMIEYTQYDEAVFWLSINPLPSFLIDGNVRAGVMINQFVPYTAIGELYLQGPAYLALFYFLIGLVFSTMERISIQKLKRVWFITGASLVIFTFMGAQYTLRGGIRPVYYAVVIFIVCYLALKLSKNISFRNVSQRQ